MTKSGALLVEVGTTNKTYLKDYENAIHRKYRTYSESASKQL